MGPKEGNLLETNKTMALALFGAFLLCAAVLILMGLPLLDAPAQPYQSIGEAGDGYGIEYTPPDGLQILGQEKPGSAVAPEESNSTSPEEGAVLEETPSQETSLSEEPETTEPEMGICETLGLPEEQCNDDSETLTLSNLEDEEISLDGVSFVPDETYDNGRKSSNKRRKLVVSNVYDTELTDVSFEGEGGKVILKEVSLSEIPGEAELSEAFILEKNLLGVNSEKYPDLNRPARVKFVGIYGLKEVHPLRNGEPCGPECSNFEYDSKTGKASMDVSGFSTYSIEGIAIETAEHLNSTYGFISDITPEVKEIDGDWSEEIPNSHYVRALFEENLTNGKKIDLYVRKGGASNVYLNIYLKGTTTLIGSTGPLTDAGEFLQVKVQNLVGKADTFDIKVEGDSGGYAEFDYIHDYDCVIPYDNMYINETTYLCEGTYQINDSGDTGIIIFNSNSTALICENNNVTLTGNGAGTAIYLPGNVSGGTGAHSMSVINCTLDNYQNGIYSYPEKDYADIEDSTIRNNTIRNCDRGIMIHAQKGDQYRWLIINNTITNSSEYGIYLYSYDISGYQYYHNITGNTVRDTPYGVYLNSKNYYHNFTNNLFYNISQFAVSLCLGSSCNSGLNDYPSTWQNNVGPTNKIDGNSIYHYFNVSDHVFENLNIDVDNQGTNTGLFTCVYCENVTFKNNELGSSEYGGAVFPGSTGLTVEHNNVSYSNLAGKNYNWPWYDQWKCAGISVYNSTNPVVRLNNVSSSTIGIYMLGAYGSGVPTNYNYQVYNNSLYNESIGIYLKANQEGRAYNNTIWESTDDAIRVDYDDYANITENLIYDSVDGIRFFQDAYYNRILDNEIYNMSGAGIYSYTAGSGVAAGNIFYNTIENNTVKNATYGIRHQVHSGDGRYNNFTTNYINDTTYGIYLAEGDIEYNNFVGNRMNNISEYAVYFSLSGWSSLGNILDPARNYFYCDNYYEEEKFCYFYDVHNATFADYYGSDGYDGNASNDATNLGMITTIECSNFTMSNLTLSHDREYGVLIIGSTNISVINSNLSDNGDAGSEANIRSYNSLDSLIRNNTITNGRYGVYLDTSSYPSDYAKVYNNTVENASVSGIAAVGVDYAQMENNTMRDNAVHISTTGTVYYPTISQNQMSGGDDGIYFNMDTAGLVSSATVTDNNVENVSSIAYYLNSYTGSSTLQNLEMRRNNCTNATEGVYIYVYNPQTAFQHNLIDTMNMQDVSYGLHIRSNTYTSNPQGVYNNTYSNFDINASGMPVYIMFTNTGASNPMNHTLVNFTLRNDISSDFYENEDPQLTNINVTNVSLHRNLGSIYFSYINWNASNSIKTENTVLDSDIASIDSAVHTYFVTEANVTFSSASCPANIYWKSGFPTTSLEILATGSSCPGDRCYSPSCISNIVNFTVSNFSGYTANEVQIPYVENVTLNSTFGTNYTNENLTVWYDAVDPDSGRVKNITNWFVNDTSIMVLNMPFEANAGNEDTSARDYANGLNGTPVNSPTWLSDGGFDGWGTYNYSTGSDYMNINDVAPYIGGKDFTFTAWLKLDVASGEDQYFFATNGAGTSSTNYLLFGRDVSPANRFLIYYGSNCNPGTFTFTPGKWHHVAVVVDAANTQTLAYADGEYLGACGYTAIASDARVSLGQEFDGGTVSNEWGGPIDEVRIYNRTLSAGQIAMLFNNQTDSVHSDETEAGEVWKACITPNDNVVDGEQNCSNNLTIRGFDPPTAENVTLNSTLGTNYTTENLTVYHDVYDPQGLDVYNITNWFLNDTSIMVLNMPFERINSTDTDNAWDYTPYENNGTVTGAEWSETGGHDDRGAYYVYNNYVSIPDSPSLNITGDQLTVSVWLNPADFSDAYGRVLVKEVPGNANPYYRYIIYQQAANGIMMFGISTGGSGTGKAVALTSAIDSESWSHIVGVYDGSELRIYMNGTLNNTLTGVTGNIASTTSPVVLGANTEINADYYHGYIDDVQIYPRALSAEQIELLFEGELDTLSSEETEVDDVWKACITPNNGYSDGFEDCSNTVTIGEPPVTCQVISSGGSYSLPEAASGAPLSIYGPPEATKACVVIASSDVEFSCNGYSITNDGTLDAAAFMLNGSGATQYTNITIKDCPSISGYDQGIYAYDSTYITIENSTVKDNAEHGVLSSYSNYTTLSDVTTQNNSYGVYLEYSEYANVEGSLAQNNTMHGYYADHSNNSNFTNVESYNNTLDGLYLNESYDVIIDPSKFKDNKANGINLNNADGITLQDLTITGNGANGIRANSATNIGLTNLNVSDNQGHGLHMVQSDNIAISQSTFCSNHQYGIRHQLGSGLQVSTTDICDNTEYGVYLVSSSATTINQDEIFGNGETGVFASNSEDTFILYSHFYNNGEDLEVLENAASPSPLNLTEAIFDRAAGDYQDFTNLTINDTVTSYGYSISWDGDLPTYPPGYFYFSNKYINISTTAGAPSIDYLSWHWTAGELGGYTEDDFELWEYSAGWLSMNNTPDTGTHSISLYGLNPSSGYALLQKNVTNLTVYLNAPSDGHLTTSTTITFNCSAASPSPLENITLYGNWSGGWHENETKGLSGTYDSVTFTKTLPLGTYEWNCLANDSTANTDWGDSNYTFTIRNATEDDYALGGANVTVLNSSKYNGSDLGGTYELQGGNLTGADFNLRVSTEKWAGMYGNLTARLILSEGSDTVYMYAWNWTPDSGGEVCLTQNAGPFWTDMAPTQKSYIDTAFGYNPTDSDSANSTLTDASVLINVANVSSATTGVHLSANSTFEMGAFQFISSPSGEDDFAFCVNLTDGKNYRNQSKHFELVVPATEEKGPGPLETYYVYVELN